MLHRVAVFQTAERNVPMPPHLRALHTLVHTEFRARRSAAELRHAFTQPSTARPHHARAAWTYLARWVALPMLRRKVDRLSRVPTPHPAVVPLAVLSPHAAAMPTEQPR